MLYQSFEKNGYIYPPRPEHKCPAKDLYLYDNGEYVGQPKYNGSCTVVFTNGVKSFVYNRHKELLTLLSNSKEIEFGRLAKTNNWYVFAGEYLNKGKFGETGVKERNKLVLWDVLVWDGEYLVGKTVEERLILLEKEFPCQRSRVSTKGIEMYNHLCCTDIPGIYKAPTYNGNFKELYHNICKTDLYEGLVLKKKNAKLEFGLQEINNHLWQIKCRKETKIYQF